MSTGRGEHGHLFKMPDELNLCGKLHVPATPDSSDLARNVAKIFESMPDPDMEVRQSKCARVVFAFFIHLFSNVARNTEILPQAMDYFPPTR